MTLQVEYLSPAESRFFAVRYIVAVKSGKPLGVSTLREVLSEKGWSIFGVNNAMLSTFEADVITEADIFTAADAVTEILESYAFRAYGPLADILRANDAEDKCRPVLVIEKAGSQKRKRSNLFSLPAVSQVLNQRSICGEEL